MTKVRSILEDYPVLRTKDGEDEELRVIISVIDRINQTVTLHRDAQMNILSRLDILESQVAPLVTYK